MEVEPHIKDDDRDYELEAYIDGHSWPEMGKEMKLRCLAYLVGVHGYTKEKCVGILDGAPNSVKQYIAELRRDGKLEKLSQKKHGAVSRRIGLHSIPSLNRPEPPLSPREQELLQKIPQRRRV